MKRVFRRLCAGLLPTCALILGLVGYTAHRFPDRYYATEASGWTLHCGVLTSACEPLYRDGVQAAARTDGTAAQLRLWGVFPVKDVTVQLTKQPTVVLGGTPFGVKLYTDGVLVVGLSAVDGTGGSPAKRAGVQIGDTLLSVDGQAVATNEEVAARVAASGGRTLTLRLRRDGVEFDTQLTPAHSAAEGMYKIGMWVRDSSAGIGTLTFYDPESGVYAGLGHAICDVDTGKPLPVGGGELVPATVFGIVPSTAGKAGELRGCFESGVLGRLCANATTGIYGVAEGTPTDVERIPLALKQQVTSGAAQVYTTLGGSTPAWYDIEIEQVRYHDNAPTQNMVIRITDERLLAQTGGIVQGMSGSPIVQNGRLVGAVTHVFVNDPHKGYAIFAENMYRTAAHVAAEALQDAA